MLAREEQNVTGYPHEKEACPVKKQEALQDVCDKRWGKGSIRVQGPFARLAKAWAVHKSDI